MTVFSYLKSGGKWGLAWLMLIITFSSVSSLAAASSATQTQQNIKMIIVAEALKSRHVSPSLALAVAEVESGFRPQVVSHKGAIGVMQIMPATSRQVFGVNPNRLYQPDLNIRLGIQFLDDLIATYDGRVEIALSHYNGGSAVGVWPNDKMITATITHVVIVVYLSNEIANKAPSLRKQKDLIQAKFNIIQAKENSEIDLQKEIFDNTYQNF